MSTPAYFIPAQESTDPEGVADAFSEALQNSYGRWYAVLPQYQTLLIDTTNKVMRNGALWVSRGFDSGWKNGPATTNAFYFRFNNPQDLRDLSYISFLIHTFDRHYDNANFTVAILLGTNNVSLTDANGVSVYSPFFTNDTNVKPWTTDATNPRQYMKSDFTGSSTFDWSRVVAITYYIGIRAIDPTDVWAPNGYDIWIDGGPFMVVQGTELPVVQILCENASGYPVINKNAQWYNYQTSTDMPLSIPTTIRPTAGNYGIEAKDSNFLRWNDGDTNRLKKFTVPTSGLTTLTAIYSTNGNGGGGINPLLVGGVIVIGGVAVYYLTKARK